MRSFRGLLLVAAIWTGSEAVACASPLRVAVEGDGAYAPFSFFDSSGKLAGFDIEIARALCEQVPDGCEIVPVNWETIIDGLADQRFDAAVASIAFSKERAGRIVFGAPYYRSHSVFIGRPDRFAAVTPDALKGVRLASSTGTIQQQFLVDGYKQSTIVEAKDMNDAYAKLKEGSVDLVLGDAVAFMEFLQSANGADFGFVGDPLTGEALQSAAYITLRKGLEDKAPVFAEALKRIRLDGTYDRINRVYVPFSIY